MRERLIELIRESHCVDTWNHYTDDFKEPNPIYELTDAILKDGWIRPPCKVGDRLYWINRVSEEVETDRVIALHLYETKFVITTSTVGGKSITTYDLNRLLEIMYFTKEEAEAALKGGAE